MLNKDFMESVEAIDRAIALEKEIGEKKAELDKIKARLQADALKTLEDTGSKYMEVYGTKGSMFVTYKEKCEVDNLGMLSEIFGSVLDGKVKKEEAIKFTLDSKFKASLIALYKGEFENQDIKEILKGMGLNEDSIKLALKKLKGDYAKDIALLKSLGVDTADGRQEEIDAIKQAKNYENISKYIDIDKCDLEKLKRAITVEESIAIGLSYDEAS